MTRIARVSPTRLKPLSSELSPELFSWATELRDLFASTGLSVNRFTLLYPQIDKGTISRYLNGKRVPRDRWFLDTLVAIREDAGAPLTPAACAHLTELQLRALGTAHPHEYKVRKVTDELELAVTRQREAERYAHNLEQQLAERNQQLHKLTIDKERLRLAWDQNRECMQAELHELNSRITDLNQEIIDLSEQLGLARDRSFQSEHRCRQLEELLHQLSPYPPADHGDHPLGQSGDDALVAARVLDMAQETADQALEDARREAEETVARARMDATQILANVASTENTPGAETGGKPRFQTADPMFTLHARHDRARPNGKIMGDSAETSSISRMLQLAQDTADQTISDARREADEILRRSRREAEAILMRAKARSDGRRSGAVAH